MATNRRDFLRNTLIGAGVLSTGLVLPQRQPGNRFGAPGKSTTVQYVGFAAPKLDKVRSDLSDWATRARSSRANVAHQNVEIAALCDQYGDRVDACQRSCPERTSSAIATAVPGSLEKMCERPDIDLVYICTPWALHAPMAVYVMEHGKHAATEVPAAVTLDECWQLVEISEKTQKHCMMLENCCYDFFELLTLNMARQGFFGEIVHGEGAYIHDLLESNFEKNGYAEMWRLKENLRNGNLYPTHGLGPICQIMNINRGDRMDYLTSLQSADFMMEAEAQERAMKDNFYTEFVGKKFRGNMNTTLIRTVKGRSIMIQHDVTSPRPYSRIHLVSGTKGVAQKWPSPPRIATRHEWLKEEEIKKLQEQYTPEIVRRVGEMARQIGGHGGMDFMMDWRLIDCLRNGLPLDQDVYDAALWSSIAR